MGEPTLTNFPRKLILGKLKRHMMPLTLQKKRRVYLAKTKQRHCERSALPVRLTSCIFKRQVTRIISHPGNEVRCHKNEETLKKPQQLSAYRRLQGLQACSEGELKSRGAAESLHTSPEPTMAWSSDWAEMPPGVGFYLPLLHYRQPITAGDIRKQSLKVKKARERLATALRADKLAREAESQELRIS